MPAKIKSTLNIKINSGDGDEHKGGEYCNELTELLPRFNEAPCESVWEGKL